MIPQKRKKYLERGAYVKLYFRTGIFQLLEYKNNYRSALNEAGKIEAFPESHIKDINREN